MVHTPTARKLQEVEPSGYHSSSSKTQKQLDVDLLDGSQISLIIDKKTSAFDVIEHVSSKINLADRQYFGIAVPDAMDELSFLLPEARLWKYAAASRTFFKVKFRIRHFVEDISIIKDNLALSVYFQQIRAAIVLGDLQVEDAMAVSLAALMLQAEKGDMTAPVGDSYFRPEDFLPSFTVQRLGGQLYSQVGALHARIRGVTRKQAELEFLKLAQKNPEYGSHMFRIWNKAGDQQWIGISYAGVTTYNEVLGQRYLDHRFLWPKTRSIVYKNTKLTITDNDGKVYVGYTRSYKKCEYIISNCRITHEFASRVKKALARARAGGQLSSANLLLDVTPIATSSAPAPAPVAVAAPSVPAITFGAEPAAVPALVPPSGVAPPPPTGDLARLEAELQETIERGLAYEQYEELNLEMSREQIEYPTATNAVNKDKNRYRNVLPIENTRVRLTTAESDYINANFIEVQAGTRRLVYIASQGPLPTTSEDFWRMVWEQKVPLIVMATKVEEAGKVKCHKYYPDSVGEAVQFGPFRIMNVSQDDCIQYIRRHFEVTNVETDAMVSVTQLHHVTWPDHGVPSSPSDILDFVREMHRLSDQSKPTVVHCSAGIGRTGTLIVVDVIMEKLRQNERVDIMEIVRELRQQRAGMVQTPGQYQFCYVTFHEEVRQMLGLA
eukprot:Opistho-2@62002